ncbi:MAG: hypothetical protein JWO60_2827 [Frankiales bacterium]|nr:hypothetical protein [Frankiales bacterium]
MPGGQHDGELGAVLCALAGPRRGDAVAAVGAPPVAVRALLAATGSTTQATSGARLVLTGDGDDAAREALRLLAPGGRLVGVADSRAAACARVARLGLQLRHVEPVGDRVAWSAVSTASP